MKSISDPSIYLSFTHLQTNWLFKLKKIASYMNFCEFQFILILITYSYTLT